ncbi:EamA family transporter [Flavobacteriaceae bacterium SZ-1-7]|uniref:DMT family transporter n=1 Tax=Tamlana sedimenti TaxID=3134126 RepID=UPI003122AAF6
MLQNTTRAHLALLATNIIYGANYIIAKGIMPNKIGPSAFIFIRLSCCVLLFWTFKLLFVKEKVAKKDLLKLALCGLFGGALNQMLFFHGINLTSPIDASIIQTAAPVLVLIFSFFILKERITKNKIVGIALAASGAIFLILYGNKTQGTSSFLGNLYVFLNAASFALYMVLAKTLMQKYNALTVISYIFLFGFIYVFPFGINDFLNTNFEAFTTSTYLTIGYVVLFTTFLAYLFNIYALKYVMPSVASSYVYLQPVVSFVLVSIIAFLFVQSAYAQDISFIKILCCILVATGVYITGKREKKPTK